jgi:lactate racemase
VSTWLMYGTRGHRWDAIRMFGRPPVLAPPAWALAERTWEGIGVLPSTGTGSDRDGGAGNVGAVGALGGALPAASVLDPEYLDAEVDRLVMAVPATAQRIALVVPDGTRVGPWRDVLPRILPALDRAVPRSRRTLLVASGVHAVLGAAALFQHLLPADPDPSKTLEEWAVIHNGDNGFRDHVAVGQTPAGTPVRLHPAYLDADWRILLGDISWHYFAGFGGGRKLVFPGLAEPSGVAMNHRRAVLLPPEALSDPGSLEMAQVRMEDRCGPGKLDRNPVHEDLEDAVALAPPHWVVTVVDDPPPDPDPALPMRFGFRVHQGPYPAAFVEATTAFEQAHRIGLTAAPRVLLADAGGRPRDATFLQAHKSLQHGVRFVQPGGRLLLAAECGDGLGSATLARYASDPEHFRPLAGMREDPLSVIHVQTLAALLRAVRSVDVGLWSGLPADAVRALGMTPLSSEEEARAWVVANGPGPWGWLPRAERYLPPRGFKGGAVR